MGRARPIAPKINSNASSSVEVGGGGGSKVLGEGGFNDCGANPELGFCDARLWPLLFPAAPEEVEDVDAVVAVAVAVVVALRSSRGTAGGGANFSISFRYNTSGTKVFPIFAARFTHEGKRNASPMSFACTSFG